MRHRELVNNTLTVKTAVHWMIQENYLQPPTVCPKCEEASMVLNFKRDYCQFKCTRCCKTLSVFKNTILFKHQKNLIELLDLFYFWSLDLVQKKVAYQANTLSHDTLSHWFNVLNKLSVRIIRSENAIGKIGGVNHRVQIDESKFSKRKYEVGRVVRSPWIVGGIDMTTKEVFFVETYFRDANTLNNIIINHVEEGSIIHTDCWRGYSGLSEIGFEHYTVNHSNFFVDPITGINTQLIENTWGVYKRKFRARGLNYRCDLNDYFLEFYFKLKYGNAVFEKILQSLYLV